MKTSSKRILWTRQNSVRSQLSGFWNTIDKLPPLPCSVCHLVLFNLCVERFIVRHCFLDTMENLWCLKVWVPIDFSMYWVLMYDSPNVWSRWVDNYSYRNVPFKEKLRITRYWSNKSIKFRKKNLFFLRLFIAVSNSRVTCRAWKITLWEPTWWLVIESKSIHQQNISLFILNEGRDFMKTLGLDDVSEIIWR